MHISASVESEVTIPAFRARKIDSHHLNGRNSRRSRVVTVKREGVVAVT